MKSSLYYSTAATTFLSAFLLFQVQPLISKHILPWFGGGSMVWITALCVFMILLLAGYLYVLFLSLVQSVAQKIIHGALVLVVMGWLAVRQSMWPSAITPLFIADVSIESPELTAIAVLLGSVGLPFFLLATTSSLLQLWYGTATGHEPFSLYAVSNVGSLAGLLSYPFLFEPLLSTIEQGIIWTTLYGVYAIGVLWVMIAVKPSAPMFSTAKGANEPPSRTLFLLWVAVASIPVIAMLTVTNFISGFVASIPLMWVVPLALYLVSFVLVFRQKTGTPLVHNGFVALLACIAAISISVVAGLVVLPIVLIILWTALFFIAHYCHEWLYEHRPAIAYIPWFYVALSIGGVVGSSVVLVSALFIFTTPREFLWLLISIAIFALIHLYREYTFRSRWLSGVRWPAMVLFVALLLCSVLYREFQQMSALVVSERNFYGAKAVMTQKTAVGERQVLIHEGTTHGYQFTTGPYQTAPTSYYVETSGVGRLVRSLQTSNESIQLGVVGLGVGTMSAYCRPEDTLTFFEIDPQVVIIAETLFSYVAQCPQYTIRAGDARQLLADKKATEHSLYDVLVIDAYTDDSVPVHLLTVEAMTLYQTHLTAGGVVAFHISSRYLDLLPVLSGLAQAHGLSGRYYTDEDAPQYGDRSTWVLLTTNTQLFTKQEFANFSTLEAVPPLLWTDTKNAIFPLVTLPSLSLSKPIKVW